MPYQHAWYEQTCASPRALPSDGAGHSESADGIACRAILHSSISQQCARWPPAANRLAGETRLFGTLEGMAPVWTARVRGCGVDCVFLSLLCMQWLACNSARPGAGAQGEVPDLARPARCAADFEPCTQPGDCCSGYCDAGSGLCQSAPRSCQASGQSCSLTTDCCVGSCDPDSLTCLPECRATGKSCDQNESCCSGICDGSTRSCAPRQLCLPTGTVCGLGAQCCGLSCLDQRCRASCQPDGAPCSTGNACCSGLCSGSPAVCQALQPGVWCKSSGNPCLTNADCCSGLCDPTTATCSLGASGCRQYWDICSRDSDCCYDVCWKTGSDRVGTCAAPPLSGTGNPQVAGVLCRGCVCSSNLCRPNAYSGVSVCQVPSGCRQTNESCLTDSDCCGYAGSGLPGDGQVRCAHAAGYAIGHCGRPTGCNPQGNSCQYSGAMAVCGTTRNTCCGGGSCKLDREGVPRCDGLTACRQTGETCSNVADCCDRFACVPDAGGILRCGAGGNRCSPPGGLCTVPGDCCDVGFDCPAPLGSTRGICTAPVTRLGDPNPRPLCAQYGQACTVGGSVPCCNGTPCSKAGGLGIPCASGDVDCTCYAPLP